MNKAQEESWEGKTSWESPIVLEKEQIQVNSRTSTPNFQISLQKLLLLFATQQNVHRIRL